MLGAAYLRIIDYDEIEVWQPWLDQIMSEIASPELCEALQTASPEYLQDAERLVIQEVGRDTLIETLTEALTAFHVRVFHGTRLSSADIVSLRTAGLRPLVLAERRASLVAVLEKHQRWPEVSVRLDDGLLAFGGNEKCAEEQAGEENGA